jgi:hypothetical protein
MSPLYIIPRKEAFLSREKPMNLLATKLLSSLKNIGGRIWMQVLLIYFYAIGWNPHWAIEVILDKYLLHVAFFML